MECKAARELKAEVDGRGISSERDIRSGTRLSIVSVSGAEAKGDSNGKVRLCSWRV